MSQTCDYSVAVSLHLPLVCGYYAIFVWFLTSRYAHMAANNLFSNCGPFPISTWVCMINRMVLLLKKIFATFFVLFLAVWTAGVSLEYLPIIPITYLFPFVVLGRGRKMSRVTNSNVPRERNIWRGCLCLYWVPFWRSSYMGDGSKNDIHHMEPMLFLSKRAVRLMLLRMSYYLGMMR